MANQPQPFRQHHLTRALRAAKAAGMDSVRVRLPSGVEFHIGGGEVPKAPPKKSAQRGRTYGEGGTDKMFGPQAAGPDRPGNTGKDQSTAPGAKGPTGGAAKFGPSKAAPAKAGQTGTDSARPVGGLSRPARPGECGT